MNTQTKYVAVMMTEAELGAAKELILNLETAITKSEERKYTARLTQYINSIHAMRTGSRLTSYSLHNIERTYDCASRDIIYAFTFSKEEKCL